MFNFYQVPSMRWATQLWRSFIDYMMLPKLPNVAQLNPLVTRILGQNAGLSTLQGTNSYLIGFPGYPRILIDTTSAGPRLPIYLNLLEAELRRNFSSISQPPIAAVLLTHWHPDHSSAVESVQDLVRNIHPSSNASPVPVYKYAGGPCLRSLGLYSGPLEPMVDGQTFPVPLPRSLQGDFASGNPSLTVISTPGHAVDHVCFLLRSNGLPLCLFTGDLILGHGSTIVSDLSPYLRSLKKLSSMLGDRLMHKPPIYPAHGEVVNDALAKVTEYLQHRQQRIKEFDIRSGVRQGCMLPPMLFNYAIDWIHERTLKEGDGVEFAPGHRLTDLDHADDIALLASSFGDLQSMVSRVNEVTKSVGLCINAGEGTSQLSSGRSRLMPNGHLKDDIVSRVGAAR
nr:unnamed protein product [Spirometra erinaceieuropaei]